MNATKEQIAKHLLDNNFITFYFTAEPEENSPEYHEKQYGLNKGFAKNVRRNMEKDYYWGWCGVNCVGILNGIKENSYIGGCSYESKEDFINNSGYVDDMKQEIANEIAERMVKLYDFYPNS